MELKKIILQKVAQSDRRVSVKDLAEELSFVLGVPPKRVTRAMNELVFEGELEFTFYGRNYIELPIWNFHAA
jgi:hypothetical protein